VQENQRVMTMQRIPEYQEVASPRCLYNQIHTKKKKKKKVELNQEPRTQPILESRILISTLKPPSGKRVQIDQSLYISVV
jgi:hypothetical protein